jgi:pimeloyl-ACP methyl ester carboxylesterase
MSTPGLLHVGMQPKPGLSLDQYHEWYNNEHGPTRLRLPHIFKSGLRYVATDGVEPTYLAAWDITSMSHLETETYTSLRENRSPREAATISQVDVKRNMYDLLYTKAVQGFTPVEDLTDEKAEGRVLVAVDITTKNVEGAGEGYQKWFIEEHAELLAKVPGWLRSRLYKTSSLEKADETVYFAMHEYEKTNGLGGDAHKASMDTPWRTEIFDKYVGNKGRRTYKLFYVFSQAPRDFSTLAKLPKSASFTSPDSKTSTTAGPDEPLLKSYVTVADSLEIPYRIEGNPAEDAPIVAMSNSLLTDLHMWDSLVAILKKHRPEFRIVRYDTRGRRSIPQPPVYANLDMVTADLLALLDALRIPKLYALIGVSMGGITTTNFALTHPTRLGKFIACDFAPTFTEANNKAWRERTAIAEEDGGKGIVDKLAWLTVVRWFHPVSMETKKDLVKEMSDMVATNNVEGFKYSNTVLWDYDLRPKAPSCQVPGLLIVGEADAKGGMAEAMQGFKKILGDKGTELKVLKNAGHLPMFEIPDEFWEAIRDFL